MVRNKTALPFDTAIRALEAFARCHISHVIVGAAALVLHGIPRSTLDIDIVIPARGQTIRKLFEAAIDIGLKCQHGRMVSLAEKPHLLIGQWITFEDQAGRQLIDVFVEDVNQFKKLYKNSIQRRHRKNVLHIASLCDLEKMKKKSGRPIDLADVALIQEIKNIQSSKK